MRSDPDPESSWWCLGIDVGRSSTLPRFSCPGRRSLRLRKCLRIRVRIYIKGTRRTESEIKGRKAIDATVVISGWDTVPESSVLGSRMGMESGTASGADMGSLERVPLGARGA